MLLDILSTALAIVLWLTVFSPLLMCFVFCMVDNKSDTLGKWVKRNTAGWKFLIASVVWPYILLLFYLDKKK